MLYKFDKRNLFVFSMMFLLILLLRKRKFLTFTYKLYEVITYLKASFSNFCSSFICKVSFYIRIFFK